MSSIVWSGRIAAVIAIFVVSACSDEKEHTDKTLKGIASWTASAEMIADARIKGAVPQTYSHLAIERCQKEVTLLVKELGDAVPRPIQDIQTLLERMGTATSNNDRHGVETALQGLQNARSQITIEKPEP
ncbi:hypothetical protein J5289_18370 [Rhizobium sp. B230/85]|uniref:hypothetical protein n=1 Tax=unclassified Rhizobium TaxID=2613769 RepID=UPI001ADA5554|nr:MULTISPECIES: hypothetical protein [unclassified Rhizobium]MBO9136940.1 hypothetical protein [Rhizobium sp. B209b/85]QXZ98560.1 hypothetical protein J5289_18370 [Rhizobium sp. B230/85]